MKIRKILNISVFILLLLVVYFSWDDIVQALGLLGQVNLWILVLLIPIQLVSYYASGQVIFSYLRDKGNLKRVGGWQMTRMALELNFVNHILPSGGAAGFSYLTWLLTRFNVKPGRSVMAQVVRFGVIFTTFVGLILLSVIYLFFNQKINNTIAWWSFGLAIGVITLIFIAIKIIGNKRRMQKVGRWITNIINLIISKLTRGRNCEVLQLKQTEKFFNDIYRDYEIIRRDKKILKKPFLWAILANICDMGLIFITFLALGHFINPALLFIAFGLATTLSVFFFTPGGMGMYEATMIAFLTSAGIVSEVAIAGTLLARIILLFLTIVFGYLFYHQTMRGHDEK